MRITDNASRKQAAQILAIKRATDEMRAEMEARNAPLPGPKSATQMQAEEMLKINRKWDQDRDISARLRGEKPKPKRRPRD